MRKINITLLLILFLVLGYLLLSGYFFGRSPTETVVITDEGFSTEKLVVEKGTTVTWINEGERLHWPASNFHPLHNLYPVKGGCIGSAFDACRGLAKGETFSFKMEEAGIWPMHDHLAPGLTMVVEVVESKDKISQKSTSFDLNSTTPEILRNSDYGTQLSFIKRMAEEDPAEAWNFLKETFMLNGNVVGNAHEMSHIIGNELYKQSGLSGIKVCDTAFAFGCMHGVTEAMLLKEGIQKVKSIEEQCLNFFPPDKNNDYTGCIHGMGHGLYTFSGGGLKEALTNCDVLSFPYRSYCYDGVLMENSFNFLSSKFDASNPWKLCHDLDELYHQPCAKYQSQIFLSAAGAGSIGAVGKNCALGRTVLLRETCFQSLGYYVAQTSLGKVDKILTDCDKIIDMGGREICKTGGAMETIFQKYGDWSDSAYKICSTLSSKRRALCLENIKVMISQNNNGQN